ncbi:MAG: 4Fe-4S double cluster binding domain-containing protein [Oscillospiraceae bacterium]|nr:4Fe-4S double cluster binding domain-containing protein [Oscillospiraceae bacterium]
MPNLSEELRQVLLDAGAKLVGYGDISSVSGRYPIGVSVAIPVPAHIIREIEGGPTENYLNTYHALNAALNRVVKVGEAFLLEKGFSAFAQSTDAVSQDADWRSEMPHKTVATRAGLGWIGKSCLLVTPQYGSAVRISSLLTNAPLDVNVPINESRCGGCAVCVKACPAQALKGTLWSLSVDRAEIVDKDACKKKQKELMMARTGIDMDLCGKCFAVCPYTRRYLKGENTAPTDLRSIDAD